MKKIALSVLFVLVLTVIGCHSKKSDSKSRIITVYPRSDTTHLFYSGVVKPIQENLVISPAGGIISKMNHHYGDVVKKGDVLFTIHSPEMERDFREAITSYLRVKQSYLTSKKSMIGTEMLYKEKIISEQEYASEKGQYQNNLLSYIEASTKLKQFLTYLPAFQAAFLNADEIDLQQATQLLQKNMDDVTIQAPASGLILFPEHKSSEDKEFQTGVEVKKSDVLVAIGDLTGLSITANVTENDINKIKPGSAVRLSFQSNLELELKGTIVSVARQAKTNDNANFSTFPVVIQVPAITEQVAQKIRIGMNTKLDILIEDPPAIKIPIEAVTEKDHTNYVTIITADGKTKLRKVITGSTGQNDVTIISGLSKGDRVLMPQ